MAEILEKMIDADVIVMATPVISTPWRQMKTLIDRTCSRIRNQRQGVLFIVTAADSNKQAMERTLEGFRGFTYCLEMQEKRALSMVPVPGIKEKL